ncbi:MAG: SHOCT domain-containing protein [Nitrosopumilus sp.]|nr:SHOCT domain-containing protein [Nitrosopumilus sp.]MDH3385101.1 SHOCT domain-containing protein [Nitrosopumilus sp.]
MESKGSKNSFLNIKQKANDVLKSSIDLAVTTSQKIDKNIKMGIDKAKDSSIVQEAQIKSNKIRSMDAKDKTKYKRKVIQGFVTIREIIFGLFEKFVGRIRIGTQYGKSSLELLSELAKLKELGIITEKEFENKKKEILDRI